MSDVIHHYTDINTLALILKNRSIRFNRLDRVDDITEGQTFTTLKLEKFFFVNCWTYDHQERLPQWNMYTRDMAGVHITLPLRMFDFKPLKVPEKYYNIIQEGSIISPIPFEHIFGKNYFIPPIFLNKEHFGRKVVYTHDYIKRKNDAIKVEVSPGGELKANISDPTGIASLKSPDWEFQKEYRYVLFIVPSLPMSNDPNFFEKFSNEIPNIVATSLYQGKGPDLTFFDVDISQSVMNQIEITAGPLCHEGDYIILEALLAKYAPNGSLRKSKFTGTIRSPRKR